MSSILHKHKITGFGLIEVLVSTVVIALGLLAIASMQGNFLSNSADNKARAEAQILAEEKIEALKNLIIVSEHGALASSLSNDTILGTNATYTRNWTVSGSNIKTINVTVFWGANASIPETTVTLSNTFVFSDPASSVSIANYGDQGNGSFGQAPSPNQNASASVENELVDLSATDAQNNDLYTVVNGDSTLYTDSDSNMYRDNGGGLGDLVVLCGGLTQFHINLSYPGNYPGSYDANTGTYTPTPQYDNNGDLIITNAYLYTKRFMEGGIEIIELYTRDFISTIAQNGDITNSLTPIATCKAEHRFFGGAIIPIKGRIYTEFSLDDIKVDHNKEDMFCTFYAGFSDSDKPYACYVGGNCAYTNGDASSITTCSSTNTARDTVGSGGFSGNIGLLNIDDDGGAKESVCFQGDLNGTSTDFFTARKYKTTNNTSGKEEGINAPYNCQDFYIVGRQANLSRLSTKCVGETGNINLPPQEIIRTITGNNIVVAENNTYCAIRTATTYALTITITNESTVGGSIVETVSGTVCTHTINSVYNCSETTYGISALINATTANSSGSCILSDLTASTACSITFSTPPRYSLSGTINVSGNPTISITADSFISGSNSCSISGSTFTCIIQTNETSVRIDASKARSIDSCNKNDLDSNTLTYSGICTLNL